jgi:hypothetical protein
VPHRTFTDIEGVEWQVWDVRPSWSWADRRHRDRRVSVWPSGALASDAGRGEAAEFPDGARPERRHGERRGGAEGLLPVRRGYEEGWLTFESVVGRRRLTPIPLGWERLPELTLAELCRRSVRVSARPRLIE